MFLRVLGGKIQSPPTVLVIPEFHEFKVEGNFWSCGQFPKTVADWLNGSGTRLGMLRALAYPPQLLFSIENAPGSVASRKVYIVSQMLAPS